MSLNGRTAIVMAHFGSTHDDARAVTTDVINTRVAEAFPGADVHEAYTSRMVIKRLADRGINRQTPIQVLDQLAAEGVDTVVVQPTFLLPGVEYDALKADVMSVSDKFASVAVGRPLLYGVDECRQVADVLLARHKEKDMRHHVVFVGHGSPSVYNALYSQIDNMFHAGGQPNFHVATIEGYPDMESVLSILKQAKARDVTLVPLLFVAGDHARNDIEVDWVKAFESRGLPTTTWIEGLGEIDAIQQLYVDRVRGAMNGPEPTSVDIKNAYLKENNLK